MPLIPTCEAYCIRQSILYTSLSTGLGCRGTGCTKALDRSLGGIRDLPLISSERPHPFLGASLVAFKARFSCRFSFSCSYFLFFFLGWSAGSSAAGADSSALFSNILLNSASLYVLFRPKLVIRVMVAAKWSIWFLTISLSFNYHGKAEIQGS